jgi:adenylate cyclase
VEPVDLAEAAERCGITTDELTGLVDLGIISPDADGRFAAGALRRAGLARSLAGAGIQLDGLGAAIRDGRVSLAFLDAPTYDRFSVATGATFAEVAERIGVPVEQLLFIREAAGSLAPQPGDRIRDEELAHADIIELAAAGGFPASAVQQMISTQGEALRRVAETESALWQAEVIEPGIRAGQRADEVLGSEFSDRMSALTERGVMAMYHLQQTRAWTGNVIEGLEVQLAAAGLHSRLTHPPAMCFLDLTGYTRLTQERGDGAAAALAGQLGRIVQRLAVQHGGRPVKWLGDGVMVHFPNPGDGVVGALEMVRAVAGAGLPPAHVGLHAGPVIFQEGDYYGSTVNLASRIADRAEPGQVLVSQAVIDASADPAMVFVEIGEVELKGVGGAMRLFEAVQPL